MLTRLLLLLCLVGQTVAKKPPDVECQVVNLEYVQCSWNKEGTPELNYTFSSWVHHQKETNCSRYLLENDTNVGCIQAYVDKLRFMTFYTVLKHGSEMAQMKHQLKNRVKLNPPTNVTVQNGSDFNLWFYWNQTTKCVEREVRYRINNNKWEHTVVPADSYCINFPSSSSTYELQVRSKISEMCGGSIFWSDWSEPVVWGFNNSTDTTISKDSMSVWTPVLYAVGAITLILLVLMLLQHERLRIILIPVVPKPSLNSHNTEDWCMFPKGLIKESFNASYTEQACPVRRYSNISRVDSNSSDTSDSTGDHEECSVFIAGNDSTEQSPPANFPTVSSEEEQQVFL